MARQWDGILSGASRGFGPSVLRGVLSLATPLYATAHHIRSAAYSTGLRRTRRASVPVVSIGNLTTGGTGKTPLVAWTVERLRRFGVTPGIVSRGYGSRDGQPNDEQQVLAALCPGVPHVQNADRAAAAAKIVAQSNVDVVVLDDGFQHRRLARDLDVVLIDALNPWGYGSLLPRGLLREPRAALGRAGFVCITRVDQIDPQALADLKREIARHTAAPIMELAFDPTGLINSAGQRAPLEELRTRSVGACCGIGHPEAFLRTLTAIGAPPTRPRFRVYPDHYPYSLVDRAELAEWVRETGIELLVVTHKDLVKLPVERIGRAPLWALEIDVEFRSGQREFEQLLRDLVRRP